MKILITVLILWAAIPAFSDPVGDQLREFVVNHPEGGEFADKISLPGGGFLPFKFECTSKGNGLLTIDRLRVRVYDSHDDGSYYENGFLSISADQREDKVFLKIAGVVLLTEETGGKIRQRDFVEVVLRLELGHQLRLVSQSNAADRLKVVSFLK